MQCKLCGSKNCGILSVSEYSEDVAAECHSCGQATPPQYCEGDALAVWEEMGNDASEVD